MPVLHAFYAQQPAAAWLAVGALLIVLELATGSGRLFWPALAALAPAALDAVHPAPGAPVDLAVFAAAAALASLAAWRLQRPATAAAPSHPKPTAAAPTGQSFTRAPRPKAPRRSRSTPVYAGLNLGGDEPTASTAAEPSIPVADQPRPAVAPTRLTAPSVRQVDPQPEVDLAPELQMELRPEPIVRPLRPPPPPIVQQAPFPPKPAKPARRAPPLVAVRRPRPAPVSDPATMKRLVGRTARSTCDFANGVGRVWIENAEWAADLEYADELPADHPVRVIGLAGALRLRVSPLTD